MRTLNVALVLISLMCLAVLSLCDGKVGYCIDVTVNNSTMSSSWSRCQSTVPQSFTAETKVSGSGNFSRFVAVGGLAKIGLSEASHGGQGRLVLSDLLSLSSQVDWIEINEEVINQSNYNKSIRDQYQYTVKINESLPTNVYSKQSIYYKGEGIYAKNSYINDDTKVFTNYHATDLLKSFTSLGILAPRAYVFANVTPARALSTVLEKRGVAFVLSSTSNLYSGFAFSSGDTLIEDTYRGEFTLNEVITHQINYTFEDKPDRFEDFLPCCDSANLYQIDNTSPDSSVDSIFNCEVFKRN